MSSARLSLIVPDSGDELFTLGVLPSLAPAYQAEIDADSYEIVVVAGSERMGVLTSVLDRVGVGMAQVVRADSSVPWSSLGCAGASAEHVALFGAPGVASPLIVAALFAALDAYPDRSIVIPTFSIDVDGVGSMAEWLSKRRWPEQGDSLVTAATSDLWGPPPRRWLDPIDPPDNLVVPRRVAADAHARGARTVADVAVFGSRSRVQLAGDALVRPGPPSARNSSAEGKRVEPGLEFFGRVRAPREESVRRPLSFVSDGPSRLSIVQITYDMNREMPRTLTSLARGYQRGIESLDRELIVVDNGSSLPLTSGDIAAVVPDAQYHVLGKPSRSLPYAINYGAARATGDVIAVLNDACLMSPGLFDRALRAFRCFPRPVVIAQNFHLGPGLQVNTIAAGYDKAEEDRLLASIDWPSDGYRLFEISSPQTLAGTLGVWLGGWFESDCIVMHRSLFEEIGGCDERFDYPGGGLAIMDLLVRAWSVEDTQPVKILGEGAFHQLHGGITTNTDAADVEQKVRKYKLQYESIRGPIPPGLPKSFYFSGRLPTAASRARMKD